MAKQSFGRRWCPKARQEALDGYRLGGSVCAAGRAAGVNESTVRYWLETHEGFAEEMQAARKEYIGRVGFKGITALEQRLDREIGGGRRPDRYAPVPGGKGETVLVEKGDLYEVPSADIRTAITLYDPRLTHPKTESEVTLKTAGDLIDELPEPE